MALGKITSPTTWLTGTVVSPGHLQKIQDNINALLASTNTATEFREDFIAKVNAQTATNSVVGQFMFTAMSNASVQTDLNSPDANTHGFLSMSNTGAATPSMAGVTSVMNIGSNDFYFSARIKLVSHRAELSSSNGFSVFLNDAGGFSSFVGVSAGSGSANWQYRKPGNGAGIQDSGAVISTTNWIVFELSRVSNTFTYTIDGANTLQVTNSDTYGNTVVQIGLVAASSFANAEVARVDYVGLLLPRPATG